VKGRGRLSCGWVLRGAGQGPRRKYPMNASALLLFAAIAVPCAMLAVKYWQHALFGVFVLLVFEGALRKWAFPWAQAQIYLVKDAILLAVYVGFLLDGRKNQPSPTEAG